MEILLVVQIIVVLALIAVILIQKTSSDGFTGGSSSPNSFLTGRASANLFTRATSILAAMFILNSLALAYIASHTDRGENILESAVAEAEQDKAKTDKATDTKELAVPVSETTTTETTPAAPEAAKPVEKKAKSVPVSE